MSRHAAVCCRLDAHKHVLESATAVLLKRIQSMQTEGLLKLLADTFIYVSQRHMSSQCAQQPQGHCLSISSVGKGKQRLL